jgi:hypothetical protein
MRKLLYVGHQAADDLSKNIHENLDRYKSGDFLDLESSGDWRIPLSIEVDLSEISQLKPSKTPEDEISNSILVGKILRGLTPTLARENRIWIRLSHVECFEYSRKRWLPAGAADEDLEKKILDHFFASTLTQCRDDHAISRLWWNYRIAAQAIPNDPPRALKVILARADIRLNLVQRSGIGSRPSLCFGIVRALERTNDLLKREDLFREFMKKVNLLGAGVAFEILETRAIDEFMDGCIEKSSSKI